MGEDNGCFYRYAQLGRCDGPVESRDRYGNLFCRFHLRVLPDIEEIVALKGRQNITFMQAYDVYYRRKRFERLKEQRANQTDDSSHR